ncbi:MAG: peptidoglycan editing factor PgeF [Clostridia bacterium]|nr:peptidoglycan editing factor PgeF [Clostridia bacterium]
MTGGAALAPEAGVAAELPPPARGAVTTRLHGASRGRLRWNNFGARVGDRAEALVANWLRLCARLGRPPTSLVRIGQVHGDDVLVAGAEVRPGAAPLPAADALVTAEPELTLVVLVADCAPVFLADPEAGVVALAHSGWRGTLAGLPARTVRRMTELGARPSRVVGWIGPRIGPCCYEVGEDVARRAARAFPGDGALAPVLRPGRRPRHAFLDLAAAIRASLREAGVDPEAVSASGFCTSCRTDLFYSHRAEGGATGRMAAAIWLESVVRSR